MSERYSHCPRCWGTGYLRKPETQERFECPRCHGTGFDGSADAYNRRREVREDYERMNPMIENPRRDK